MKVTVWHAPPPGNPATSRRVAHALAELGEDVDTLVFDSADLYGTVEALAAKRPDAVFNLVEEAGGDLALSVLPTQILETLNRPFTGCGSAAIGLTTHKLAAKSLLAAVGLPTPAWISAEGGPGETGAGPFLIKPVCGDGSQGLAEDRIELADTAAEARAALARAERGVLGGWFAERYVAGRELSQSLLEREGRPQVLPAAEFCFVDYPADKPRIVGYRGKWEPDSFEYRHLVRRFDLPAEDAALVRRLGELSLECWRLFGLRGYARIDFRIDADGRPWILEVNSNPSMCLGASFPAAAEHAGLSFYDLVGALVAAARTPPDHDRPWMR